MAKTRSNGACLRKAGAAVPSAVTISTIAANAVEPRIGTRDADRADVDVGCKHTLVQRAGGRNGKHAAASPEVEDAHNMAPVVQGFAQPIEREEAAARGAMMAGAKGERRLDLDADAVCRDAGTIVRTVDNEAAGLDRRQAGEAVAHPVGRRDQIEMERFGGSSTCRGGRQRAQRIFIGRGAKMNRDPPSSAARIHKRDGDIVAVIGFGNDGGDPAGGLFIRCQRRDRRGRQFRWH